MKQFIYLDTDIINSIIAQNEKGLVMDKKLEKGLKTENIDADKISTNIEGNLSGGLKSIAQLEAKINLESGKEKENNTSNTYKEIIEKTLNDAAFDVATNYIQTNNLKMDEDSEDIGEYVKLDRVFDFVDLDYLEDLFSKDGLIEYLKRTEEEELSKSINSNLNRQQLRGNTSKINSEIRKIMKEKNQQYDSIITIIKAFKKLIPYNKMLISYDGYLIPLDKKYFRVNPSSIGFMYGGEITCVGMISNIIGKDTNPNDSNNIFASLQFSVNEMLRSILPTRKENIFIIHPIAVYYNK